MSRLVRYPPIGVLVIVVALAVGSGWELLASSPFPGPVPVAALARSMIDYQIHSQDDLRQWPQTLNKGATWFKFDLNYQPPSFCQYVSPATSRVDPSTSSLGCFLLNHDNPVHSRPVAYNTSDDLLNMLEEEMVSMLERVHKRVSNGEILNLAQHLPPPLSVALCAKYSASLGGICDGSESSRNATTLFTLFFQKAQKVISKLERMRSQIQQEMMFVGSFSPSSTESKSESPPLLEFILDGALTPGGKGVFERSCLRTLWRPWNATYILMSDPAGAFTSNDVSRGLGFERFQINNMDEISFAVAASKQYGKFQFNERDPDGYTKPYPYLIWEPSPQWEISADILLYRKGTQHDQVVGQGLRFAINIDPVQWQVYSAATSGNAWNFGVSTTKTDTAPRVAVWSPAETDQHRLLLSLWYDAPKTRLMYRAFTFTDALGTAIPTSLRAKELLLDSDTLGWNVSTSNGQLGGFQSLGSAAEGAISLAGQRVQHALYLAAEAGGGFMVVDGQELVDSSSPAKPTPVIQGRFPQTQTQTGSFSRSAAVLLHDSQVAEVKGEMLLVHVTSSNECQFEVRAYLWNATSSSSTSSSPSNADVDVDGQLIPFPEKSTQCFSLPSEPHAAESKMHQHQDTANDDTVDLSVTLTAVGPNDHVSSCGSASFPTSHVLLVSTSRNGVVFGAAGCISVEGGSMQLTNDGVGRALGVGTHPATSSLVHPSSNDGRAYMLMSMEDSYCYSNEPCNKRAEIALCNSIPNPQDQVLGYSVGPVSAWLESLTSPAPFPAQMVFSPCGSSQLLHGTFDMGSASSIQLFAAPTLPPLGPNSTLPSPPAEQPPRLYVAEAHRGFGSKSNSESRSASASSSTPSSLLSSVHERTFPTQSSSSHPRIALVDDDEESLHATQPSASLLTDRPQHRAHVDGPRRADRSASEAAVDMITPPSSNPLATTSSPAPLLWKSDDPIPPSVCGNALSHNGIVVDGWAVPSLELV